MRFLPKADVASHHAIDIAAPPDTVYRALRSVDMRRSRLIRTLFRLRRMPAGPLTLADFEKIRFVPLEEAPPDDLTLGLIGRFWTLSGGLRRFEPHEFEGFGEPGFAKAVWSFRVAARGEGARLTTETRVQCTDASSRRRFRRYWLFVGPFSGFIRRELLRLVRDEAERLGEEQLS